VPEEDRRPDLSDDDNGEADDTGEENKRGSLNASVNM